MMDKRRCVIIGGADIRDYARARSYLREDDFVIYCDSGLKHLDSLGAKPSLIVGDFDSYDNPHADVETIVLPVAKDDTDTVYAEREGLRRGYEEFLLLGVFGGRMDHTLANAYILFDLDSRGCRAAAADDYSEFEVLSSDGPLCGHASVEDSYPFFSLVNMTGTAKGITITGAKFPVSDAEIRCEYQYAVSNEVLPGQTAEITIKEGSVLLIMDL